MSLSGLITQLAHYIRELGDKKEGLTKEGAIQRTHTAETGSLSLFSAFILSLQSPGNQGRDRANKKGPGT